MGPQFNFYYGGGDADQEGSKTIQEGELLIFKKAGNAEIGTPEPGDIVKAFVGNRAFEGIYKGGDPLEVNEENYTFITNDKIVQ